MTNTAVIGMGTMGPGIAATLARGGMSVRVFDTSAEALERSKAGMELANNILEAFGTPDRRDGREISLHGDLDACLDGVGLVVETVPEKLEIKAEVFRQVDQRVSRDCILATNTSGIPITKLQAGTSNPGRVVGMHWSNPAHVIPMIEVIAGKETAPETVGWMVDSISLCLSFGH